MRRWGYCSKVRTKPASLMRLPKLAPGGDVASARKGERLAWSPREKQMVPHAVYDRYQLGAGAELSGPAIIEERESTTVVGEEGRMRVNDFGFLDITLAEGA